MNNRGVYGTALVLLAVLPMWEAPKNLASLALLLIWLLPRVRAARDAAAWGGSWDRWDSLFLTWFLSTILVAVFAGLHNKEWGGVIDALRYISIAWIFKRTDFTDIQYRRIIEVMLLSTIATLGYAWYAWRIGGTRSALELNSVGHVNHSAIYLTIATLTLIAMLIAAWERWTPALCVLATLSAFALIYSIFVTSSRGAVGILLIGIVLLGGISARRNRRILAAMALVVVGIIAIAWFGKAQVIEEQHKLESRHAVLEIRQKLWNTAVLAWQRYPLFGVGLHNFSSITPEDRVQWSQELGRVYDPDQYTGSSHAHSLIFNTLAERGTVGFGVLVGVLLAWLSALVLRLPPADGDWLEWTLWGGAASAWLTHVGVGLVNTTLHHEHAILGTALLGLWLGYVRQQHTHSR